MVGSDDLFCAVGNGQLYCWGTVFDWEGQQPMATAPATLPGIGNVLRTAPIASNGFRHSCVLQASGQIRCWGSNTNGQIGTGGVSTYIEIPTAVGADTYVDVGTTYGLSCGITDAATGKLYCWGGMDGATLLSPTEVTLPAEPVELISGPLNLCVQLADGTRACYGANGAGEDGSGNTDGGNGFVTVNDVASDGALAPRGGCWVRSGVVSCYGESRLGLLGARPPTATPARVSGVCE
jgi:alpha-tubulin suppressor-like RCC1 family protein